MGSVSEVFTASSFNSGHAWIRGPGKAVCSRCMFELEVPNTASAFKLEIVLARALWAAMGKEAYTEAHAAGRLPSQSCDAYREHVVGEILDS